jgi:hypothetical protein
MEPVMDPSDENSHVSIANTRPVIPPEQVHRLFEPFQRLGTGRCARTARADYGEHGDHGKGGQRP